MTDAEISRRLALAIGWPRAVAHPDGIYVREFTDEIPKLFDYRDPAVIWPIAVEYKAFPNYCEEGWHVRLWEWLHREFQSTPEKAVALAVIKAHEAKK